MFFRLICMMTKDFWNWLQSIDGIVKAPSIIPYKPTDQDILDARCKAYMKESHW
jgi:hypothetical protein